MKVIVAGYPDTGTESICNALKILGYSVYSAAENLLRLEREWNKLLMYDGSSKDLKVMYENVDAVVDVPACLFWEEIHEAFPDAKIILTTQVSEDVWVERLAKSVNRLQNNFMIKLLRLTSPTIWKMEEGIIAPLTRIAFGFRFPNPLSRNVTFNKCLAKKRYRAHNAHVLQNAPKDKLLVYNTSYGWRSLCQFLSKPVPDIPFPTGNVRDSVQKEWLSKDLQYRRIRVESCVSVALVTLLSSYGAYKIISKFSPQLISSIADWTEANVFRM